MFATYGLSGAVRISEDALAARLKCPNQLNFSWGNYMLAVAQEFLPPI
jgi:hypothetical protein